ncbi:SpaH/EbpB family LPXTG-anchored major pilin [Antribacter gilvus]|uniref:SpaH/EbpB family LPXTG-anchored major pilin n=1 Tax=Antribacter gilvus TaxID=2304675 RepID=UPI0013DF4667|nr:SpaH/EbpB family LPXTG-anchored major pilin [Antribacter gilvus]
MRTIGTNRRTGAGVMAVLAASALALGFGIPAASAANVALPDGDETGELVITKHESPAGTAATGLPQEINTETNPTIDGVTFKVQQVTAWNDTPIDLTTNEGWALASTVDIQDMDNATLSEGTTKVTGADTEADGVATFGDLPLGLYYVTEVDAPAGVLPGIPFLVTIPMTNPDTEKLNEWMYTVYVYPKNDTAGVTKSVDDSTATYKGQPVSWTVLGDIPTYKDVNGDGELDDPGESLAAYKITDQLDSALTYQSATVSITTSEALTADDYTLSHAAGLVTVEFKPSGVAKLSAAKAANAAAQVSVVIVTTVNDAVGQIPNEAGLWLNGSETAVESNVVSTYWGGVLVEKVDAALSTTKLAGAQFQVFASEADADAQANPITISGASTFTTGSNGQIAIDGLQYDADGTDYWLVEVKAPTGYELLAEPIKVTVDGPSTGDAATDVAVVENVEHNAGFTLPLTGGSGTALLTGAGVVVLAAAMVLVARSRRQTDEV